MIRREALPDRVSVGLHVPAAAVEGLASRDDYIRFFKSAEQLGFDAVWAEDRIFHPAHLADPFVLLTLAAAHTETLLLGTAVAVLNFRDAPVLARQLATLDHFSGGRVVAGVSLGGRPDEYAAMRGGTGGRVSRFNESVAALRGLLSGTPQTSSGPLFKLDGAAVRPASGAPLLIGGVVERALRRAGRLGDGWIMAPFGTLDDFRRGWDVVRASARAAGRDPARLSAGRLIYICPDCDAARARSRLDAFLVGYYGRQGVVQVDRDGLFGRPEDVASQVVAHVDAGITNLILALPDLDTTSLALLADALFPALRGRI
ncbi:MAG: LLM class flavin-dependent oxidoreductase [Pseudomonadota bacterium]